MESEIIEKLRKLIVEKNHQKLLNKLFKILLYNKEYKDNRINNLLEAYYRIMISFVIFKGMTFLM